MLMKTLIYTILLMMIVSTFASVHSECVLQERDIIIVNLPIKWLGGPFKITAA